MIDHGIIPYLCSVYIRNAGRKPYGQKPHGQKPRGQNPQETKANLTWGFCPWGFCTWGFCPSFLEKGISLVLKDGKGFGERRRSRGEVKGRQRNRNIEGWSGRENIKRNGNTIHSNRVCIYITRNDEFKLVIAIQMNYCYIFSHHIDKDSSFVLKKGGGKGS